MRNVLDRLAAAGAEPQAVVESPFAALWLRTTAAKRFKRVESVLRR